MDVRMWFAKMRYPMPEEGDFSEELPLDEHRTPDGDDTLVGITQPVRKSVGKKKGKGRKA